MAYRDPEKQRAYAREWLKRNPEKAREATRRWNKTHPEERRARKRLYYARHRTELLAQNAEYHRAHPEIGRARWQNYRARKGKAEGRFTPAEWLARVEEYGGRCAYCGATGPLQADHRIPLSRGGTNRIENILPACNSCNASKHKLTETEFRARLAAERDPDLQFD